MAVRRHSRGGAVAGRPASVDNPSSMPGIVLKVPGMAVLMKPVGWEVDIEDVGLGRWASLYVQAQFPATQFPLVHDPSYGFGFLHRLDTSSSGLIAMGTWHAGLFALAHELATFQLAREYLCCGIGRWKLLVRGLGASILRTNWLHDSFVSLHGQPAKSQPCGVGHFRRKDQHDPKKSFLG